MNTGNFLGGCNAHCIAAEALTQSGYEGYIYDFLACILATWGPTHIRTYHLTEDMGEWMR